jgi:CubicO group peptidase (beta-lactamase class C family)
MPAFAQSPDPRPQTLDPVFARASELPRLRSLIIAQDGRVLGERYYNGASRSRTANVKSVSKSIISALVGIATAEGRLKGIQQPIADFFPRELRDSAHVEKRHITIGDLLSMRAGLESTSFDGYGPWVTSANWVRAALARPIVADRGGPMIYSTGNTHLLSAILTKATGMSTLAYARRKLGAPLGIEIPPWPRDPQGIYFGGNDMRLTPRAMLAIGELYRNRGRVGRRQIVPESWVDASFVVRAHSPFNGHGYGWGWWSRHAGDYRVHFAWGYGGQFIFIVPAIRATVVMTSDPEARREWGHVDALHELLDMYVIPALKKHVSLAQSCPARAKGTLAPLHRSTIGVPSDPNLRRFMVMYRDDVPDPGALTRELSVKYGFTIYLEFQAVLKGFSAELPEGVLSELRAHPCVAVINQNTRGELAEPQLNPP